MWDGLTGRLTVKNGPLSQCKLVDLATSKPGQPSEIWGRRHMVNFASLGMNLARTNYYAHDIPISFIEVIMVKTDLSGHLSRELRLSSASESTRLRQAWWGLNCEPDMICETGCCPYVWEYVEEIRGVWRRDKWMEHATASKKSKERSLNPLSGTALRGLDPFGGRRPTDVWWGKG